jgi:homoserine dehydrogenase
MDKSGRVVVGLLGMGVVGGGVAHVIKNEAGQIARRIGRPLYIKGILIQDKTKRRDLGISSELFTNQPEDLLDDPEIDIVIELIGGEQPPLRLIQEAIKQGKHVVTANKELMAKHGPELLILARDREVSLHYEASVGGGIPIIGPLTKDLLANDIYSIHAIINGTTNYILTSMASKGTDFTDALEEAKALGYAEADPINDIEGVDAAYKIAILASLAFHTRVRAQDVYHEGITRIMPRDFRYAQELGYVIKLLAIARRQGGFVDVRVHPAFVPEQHLLAKVGGVFNAVEVEGSLVGRVVFHGQGAGPSPTASAVMGDVMDIARGIHSGGKISPPMNLNSALTIKPIEEVHTRYYMRMTVADQPGVFTQISQILGERNISIASLMQKETYLSSGTAEVVIMTHPSQESSVREAMKEVNDLKAVNSIGNFVRVEHWGS